MFLSLYQLLSGNLHKDRDKINIMPYCISKPLNATMNVSSYPCCREKVGLYRVRQKNLMIFKLK